MRARRRIPSVAAVVALVATLFGLAASPSAAQEAPVEIQILSINDFHGRLEPPADTGEPDELPIGGAAQLGGLVNELEAANPNTAFVSAGDNIGASTFVSAVADDDPTLDALDAMDLDASAVGNHEFDQGYDDLINDVEPDAAFPYLGANVYLDGGDRALPPFHVEAFGGIDVGFVGVVTQETPSLVSPDGIVGLEFRDPVDEAEAVAADLKDGNEANGEADVVVLMAHEGAPLNTDAAGELEADPVFGEFVDASADIDAIVSGHTHRSYAVVAPVPGGGTRPIVQAQEYGKKLGRITLTVDPATGDVTAPTAELIDVVGITPDPAVQAIVDAAVAEAEVLGQEVIGSITDDIERAYLPPVPGEDPETDRGSESVLGNFIADVQLARTADPGRGDADIAFMNPGGLRADLEYEPSGTEEPGEVTYAEAYDVQPFANDVVTQTLTGLQIKQVLEEQWQPAGASRPVLWLGVSEGFTYQYDPTDPAGERIDPQSMQLDGVPIEIDGTYRVTTNSFLAAGGDNFFPLATGTDRVTTGDNDLTMLRDHLEANSPVTADPAPRTFAVETEYGPFPSITAGVVQQFEDLAGGPPGAFALGAWRTAIEWELRSLDELVLELLNVDVSGPAARLERLYLAFFGRPADPDGFAYWLAQLEGGTSLIRIAEVFAASPEFQRTYGSLDDGEFVELVYQNVLERDPDPGGLAFWTDQLAAGRITRGGLMALFSESSENRRKTVVELKVITVYESLLQTAIPRAQFDFLAEAVEGAELPLEALVQELLSSDEYFERFGAPPPK